VVYGLGNLIENAVDFARERVEITARWSEDHVAVTISDDGLGFAPDIIDRIGEPYVTSRRRSRAEGKAGGLGLGFFIAKTLLERSGATVRMGNKPLPHRGAVVAIQWSRVGFERLPALEPEVPEIPGTSFSFNAPVNMENRS
jgi:two-component system sensor histidine kinase RegB